MSNVAIITGVTGQDGYYMSKLLSELGYEVHGTTRSHTGVQSFKQLERDLRLVLHPTEDSEDYWDRLIGELQPDELYHFAADSFVPNGWEHPIENLDSNLGMTLKIFEAVRKSSPHTRILNACSREVFGNWFSGKANELTEMRPASPYGINKAAARWHAQAYNERHGLFIANAILFNHESPRRRPEFVTRKITLGVAEVVAGKRDRISLGNLHAVRDWGYAGDFVDAMQRMLQLDRPEDFVLGTGVGHTIEDFARDAFDSVDLKHEEHINVSLQLARPNDDHELIADLSKAKQLLDWSPSVSFDRLVQLMVSADVAVIAQTAQQRKAA